MPPNISHAHQRSHLLLRDSQGHLTWASQIILFLTWWYSLSAHWGCGRCFYKLMNSSSYVSHFLRDQISEIFLLLYLPTQLPLAPSSWSTNRPDSLLSKKKIFPHYNLLSLSLQCLRPPPPHLDIAQLFFFHHLSDFVSDANIESSVPKVMVLPRLPYPRRVSCNRKHCPSSSTWNCPPSLLLWHYTQILSQPCWRLFFSPALSSLRSTLMYPNDHRKKRWQEDDGEVFKETEEELQNVQSHRSQEMSKF